MVAAWKGEFGDGANDAATTLPTALVWVTATLAVATFPLVTAEPRLLRTLFPAVSAGKALAVLAIVMAAGWLLAPVAERLLPASVQRRPPG